MKIEIIEELDNLINNRLDFYYKELKLSKEDTRNLCSKLADEFNQNNAIYKDVIQNKSNISFNKRKDLLYSIITTHVNYRNNNIPELNRTIDVAYYYHSFVYAKDNVFEVLRKNSNEGTKLKKVTKYLVNNEVRAFRNAFAHGNWYLNDSLEFCYSANVDSNKEGEIREYIVNRETVFNWSILSLCISYIVYYYNY